MSHFPDDLRLPRKLLTPGVATAIRELALQVGTGEALWCAIYRATRGLEKGAQKLTLDQIRWMTKRALAGDRNAQA